MFNNKEKKRLKAEAEAKAKEEAEFEAKFTAKQERKKVEKIIAEVDKSEKALLVKAAEAKQKGQTAIYANYVTAIKVARSRKHQAETFLAQVDVMQEMQSITNSSKELLSSMGNIMNSLGKLTLDRSAMMDTQRDFARVQQDLDRQGGTIEQFLSNMEMMIPTDDSPVVGVSVDKDIDAEIDALLVNKSLGGSAAFSSSSSSQNEDEELKKMQELLRS